MTMPKAIAVMEARQIDALPDGGGWQYEPKWDGFRCLAVREGEKVDLQGKSGKSLARFFPEVVAALAALKPRRFTLDGELAIPQDGVLDFDALQMRLHSSASRIAPVQAVPAETARRAYRCPSATAQRRAPAHVLGGPHNIVV
jgi:ATP-dependent DNA ligase